MSDYQHGLLALGLQALPGLFNTTIKNLFLATEKQKRQNANNEQETIDQLDGIGVQSFLNEQAKQCKRKDISLAKINQNNSKQLQLATNSGIEWTTLWDDDYPRLLREIADPPAILFYRGTLPTVNSNCLAVVGTRQPSAESKTWTIQLIEALRGHPFAIVSGLALGIDTIAHELALNNALPTYAILGSGLNVIYPAKNIPLTRRILDQGGGLLSEFLPNTIPDRFRFPQRNRIISGLCLHTILIEAAAKSGALGTCYWAADQGREVWALPPLFANASFAGNAAILRNGANLLHDMSDFLPSASRNSAQQLAGLPHLARLEGDELLIVTLISQKNQQPDSTGLHREELLQKIDIHPARLEMLLFELIGRQIIREDLGNFLHLVV